MLKFIALCIFFTLSYNKAIGNTYIYYKRDGLNEYTGEVDFVSRFKRDDVSVGKKANVAGKIYKSNFPSANSTASVSNETDYLEVTRSSISELETENTNEPDSNIGDNATEISGSSFSNITQDEFHKYYYSYLLKDSKSFEKYWFDFSKLNDSVVHSTLSSSYRQASSLNLSFGFPFFGHIIKKITLTTGGFLYTGDYTHSWLAATQYIAPLMANFDTNVSDFSLVKYYDNKTAFIVQWENVVLKDDDSESNFTFQAILKENGDIIFNYNEIPIPIKDIKEKDHPVKVGLSDAYFIDRTVQYVRRKTIYEYSKVSMKHADISSNSTLYFKALPTCLGFKDCVSCLTTHINFTCSWCDAAERCSDGIDRQRGQWVKQGCESNSMKNVSRCNLPSNDSDVMIEKVVTEDMNEEPEEFAHASIVIGVVVVVGLIIAVLGWLLYAFKFPLTPSGQLLIRYRPSQWRRGEAHYTPAVSRS